MHVPQGTPRPEPEPAQEKSPPEGGLLHNPNPGNVLLSHTVARAVPSALRGLTAVFGMGTGVALSLRSPGKIKPNSWEAQYAT